MPSAKDIILGQVFPVLGGVLGIIMFGSPIKAAYRTRLQKAIGVSSRVNKYQRFHAGCAHLTGSTALQWQHTFVKNK
jgi:hypothetical protein